MTYYFLLDLTLIWSLFPNHSNTADVWLLIQSSDLASDLLPHTYNFWLVAWPYFQSLIFDPQSHTCDLWHLTPGCISVTSNLWILISDLLYLTSDLELCTQPRSQILDQVFSELLTQLLIQVSTPILIQPWSYKLSYVFTWFTISFSSCLESITILKINIHSKNSKVLITINSR